MALVTMLHLLLAQNIKADPDKHCKHDHKYAEDAIMSAVGLITNADSGSVLAD